MNIPDKFSQLDYAKNKDAEGYYTFTHGKYKGEIENNLPHGKGEYIYNNGTKYQGTFVKGNIDGNGSIKYPGGGSFEGSTTRGSLESGELKYDNGDVFVGTFRDGKRHGEGKLVKSNGDVYEGYFLKDELNGKGEILYAKGDHYEGRFKDSKLNGQGFIKFKNGDRFEGRFENNFLEGDGEKKFANGDHYKGDFENDKLNGKGFIVLANGRYEQGTFRNNNLDGKGYLQKSNGDMYAGQFDMGTLDGEGSKYIQASDEFIAGNFSNGRPDGEMIVKKEGQVEGEIFDRGDKVTQRTYRNKAREELNRRNQRNIDNEIAKSKAEVALLEKDLPDVSKEEQFLEKEEKEILDAFKKYEPIKMESKCHCVLEECPKMKRLLLNSISYYCPKYQAKCGAEWEYLKYDEDLPYVFFHSSSSGASESSICNACSDLNEKLRAEAPAIIKKEKEEKRICEEWKQRGSGYDDFYSEQLEKVKSDYDYKMKRVRDRYKRAKKNIQSTKEANKKRVDELKYSNAQKIESDIAAATQKRKQALNRQAQNRLEDLERLCNINPDACPCWTLKKKKCEMEPKYLCVCSQ